MYNFDALQQKSTTGFCLLVGDACLLAEAEASDNLKFVLLTENFLIVLGFCEEVNALILFGGA